MSGVGRKVDLTHAARPEGREDFVRTEFRACFQRHVFVSLSASLPNEAIIAARGADRKNWA